MRRGEGEPLLLHRLQILQETGCDLQPSLHTRKRNKELLNLAIIRDPLPTQRLKGTVATARSGIVGSRGTVLKLAFKFLTLNAVLSAV